VHRRTGRKSLTRQDTVATAPPDLIGRDFSTPEPNLRRAADITYVPTNQGWLYLAVVIDPFFHRIVGWAMAKHMRAELVCDALAMVVSSRCPGPGMVHHSDKGSQSGFNWADGLVLRQRRHRELLRVVGDRADRSHPLRHPVGRGTGGVFSYIEGFYKPVVAAFSQWLAQPGRV